MPAGRPTKYKPEFAELARKFCLLGATTPDLARMLEVSVRSIDQWISNIPEFSQAVKAGKEEADANVAESLYHRACGYSHPEDKIFNDDGTPLIVPTIKHYPPDTAAAFIWLKNRQPDRWRDKTETLVKGTIHYVASPSDDSI